MLVVPGAHYFVAKFDGMSCVHFGEVAPEHEGLIQDEAAVGITREARNHTGRESVRRNIRNSEQGAADVCAGRGGIRNGALTGISNSGVVEEARADNPGSSGR